MVTVRNFHLWTNQPVEVLAYQHELTHHRLEETDTLAVMKYFGGNDLDDNLAEEVDDELKDEDEDDISRTIWRTIGGQA